MTHENHQGSANGQDQRNGQNRALSLGGNLQIGREVQSEPDTIYFSTGDGRTESFTPVCNPGGRLGGMLRRVRKQQAAYSSYLQGHHDRLEARLGENEAKQKELLEDMRALEAEILAYMQEESTKSANNEDSNHYSS